MQESAEMKKDKGIDKNEKDFSNRLMAFTFFYSVSIYLLFMGFHFWDRHMNDKIPEDTGNKE
jgi:hypothetical protein